LHDLVLLLQLSLSVWEFIGHLVIENTSSRSRHLVSGHQSEGRGRKRLLLKILSDLLLN